LEKQRSPVGYLPMRLFPAFLSVSLCFIVGLGFSQTSELQFQPASVGDGPKALINVINTKKLLSKGQPNALLMFTCRVNRSGKVSDCIIYRETPGSKLLKEELGYALAGCSFIPAIYDGKRVDIFFAGTVIFTVNGGKPHLMIYPNQSTDDLKQGTDFVAPQLIANSADWSASRFNLAAQKARVYHENGVVLLSITVDADGNQQEMRVISEDPPGFGLGEVMLRTYAKAKYIPGFRNGFPVECTFDRSEFFMNGRGSM
jgi:Gram-negative bacterial TonB protein C-terminal